MHHFTPLRYAWISMFCLMMLVGLAKTGTTESLPALAECQAVSDSALYNLDRNSFYPERQFTGSFATGLVFGATLPFGAGGSAALVSQSAGDSKPLGVIAGVSTAILWIWGGSRLTRRHDITVQEQYHTGLNERERKEFDLGYIEKAKKKRSAQYGIGVAVGICIPIVTVLYLASQFDYGDPD